VIHRATKFLPLRWSWIFDKAALDDAFSKVKDFNEIVHGPSATLDAGCANFTWFIFVRKRITFSNQSTLYDFNVMFEDGTESIFAYRTTRMTYLKKSTREIGEIAVGNDFDHHGYFYHIYYDMQYTKSTNITLMMEGPEIFKSRFSLPWHYNVQFTFSVELYADISSFLCKPGMQ
jgi:hypothetical protein